MKLVDWLVRNSPGLLSVIGLMFVAHLALLATVAG